MPKQIQLPDGSIGEFPDDMDDAEIQSALTKQFPREKSSGELATEGMPWYEKALVGAGGATRRAQLGVKGLVTDLDENEKEELKEWSKRKEALGGWGTAGEIGGEALLTAIPGARAAQLGGKVLTKALPFMKGVANAGGRVLNPGLVGRAATEGAVSAGMMAPGEGESRGGNMVQGAALGGALPAAVGTVAAPAKWLHGALSTGDKASKVRAAKAFERTLNKEGVQRVESAVERNSRVPSRLPQTTAAMAGDPAMGAYERGARTRGTADFVGHDKKVMETANQNLQDATHGTGLYNRIQTESGVPLGRTLGDTPRLESRQVADMFRRSEGDMPPAQGQGMADLAGDLRAHETYMPQPGTGIQRPDMGEAQGVGSTAVNASPFWRARGAVNSLFAGANDATTRTMDEAALRPDVFRQTMEAGREASRKTVPAMDQAGGGVDAIVQALRSSPLTTEQKLAKLSQATGLPADAPELLEMLMRGQARVVGAQASGD